MKTPDLPTIQISIHQIFEPDCELIKKKRPFLAVSTLVRENVKTPADLPGGVRNLEIQAGCKGDLDQSVRLIQEARQFTEKRKMANVLPFLAHIEGKILSEKGDHPASLAAFERADESAETLQMLPIQWQASAGAARQHDQLGQKEAAEASRLAARRIVDEIAGRLEDQGLREAFLESVVEKL